MDYYTIHGNPKSINTYKYIYIDWEKIPSAKKYIIQTNKSSKIIIKNIVRVNRTKLRLPSGLFKMRIGVINYNNIIESWSDWQDIVVKINKPPKPPDNIHYAKFPSKDTRMDVNLSWKKIVDPGNRVNKFIILKKKNKIYTHAGETSSTSYLIKGLNSSESHVFIIRSVNMNGEESVNSHELFVKSTSGLTCTVQGIYIYPRGYLNGLFSCGVGSLVSLIREDVFIKELDMGFVTGYWYLFGKEDAAKNSQIFPFLLTAKYSIVYFNYFSIDLQISSGVSYNVFRYNTRYFNESEGEEFRKDTAFEPIILTGIVLSRSFKERMFITGGVEYGFIVEPDMTLNFLMIRLGLGLLF